MMMPQSEHVPSAVNINAGNKIDRMTTRALFSEHTWTFCELKEEISHCSTLRIDLHDKKAVHQNAIIMKL